MSNRFIAAGIVGCLILPLAAAAQQPTRPARLVSVCAEADHPEFAQALLEVSNIGGARADRLLDELLAAHPESGLPRALKAATSANMTQAQRRSELDEAVADAAKATTPELVLVTALREWTAGRTPAALTLLDASAHLLPEEPLVEFVRILATVDPGERLKVAEAAHTRFPADPGLMNMLAYARYNTGFKEEGLAIVREYVQALPEHNNSHDSYGELLHMNGDLAGAEREYQRAIELAPDVAGPTVGAASVALSKGDVKAAQKHIENGLAMAREPMERMNFLARAAWIAALAGDDDAMRDNFNEAITRAETANMPATVRSLRFQLAAAEAATGNAARAATIYLSGDLDTPTTPLFGLERAIVFAFPGNETEIDKGVAEMERAAAAAGNTGTPGEAVHLAKLARASVKHDVATVRSELAQLTVPGYVAAGNAYLAHTLKDGRDAKGAAEARQKALSYVSLDANRAMILFLVR